ncbi:MAG: DoxX family protein [Adhaeribacter sp.]
MKSVKTTRIIFWTATAIIFLFEGLMPALTSHTELAVNGIRHLGYPDYFRVMLTVFKIAGSLALILPFVNWRLKEWAYAGFGFNLIAAFVSHWAVDGFNGQTLFPLFILAVLAVSYLSYHQLRKQAGQSPYLEKPADFVTAGLSV